MHSRSDIILKKQQSRMNRSNTPAALLSWLLGTVTLVVLFLGSNRNGVDAFSISGAPSSVQVRSGMNLFLPSQQRQHPQKTTTTTMIHMSLEDDQQQEQAETEKEETDVVADSTDEDVKEADDEATPEEEEEDPELTALKEEIASLETTLKEVRRKLAYTNDLADDFTKTGYARKVAEMENMRRARSMLQSSNKFSATAATLTEFLPILDDLELLKEKYADDEFGKQYNALPGAMRNAFSQMGVTEFTMKPGDKIDTSRMEIVESVYSAEHAKDTVIRPISMGMELSGNIIRMASCVTSLGTEITVEEREIEEEPSVSEEDSPTAENDTPMENSDETLEK